MLAMNWSDLFACTGADFLAEKRSGGRLRASSLGFRKTRGPWRSRMPDLSYQVTGVSAVARGLTPLLHFRLTITNVPASDTIHAVILQAQIQIQSLQRSYSSREKLKLADLFGSPERW